MDEQSGSDLAQDKVLARLDAVYREVQAEADGEINGPGRSASFPRVVDAEVACIAESLGPRTQVKTGIPWVLPTGRLSDKGELLDRDLLRRVGDTRRPLE